MAGDAPKPHHDAIRRGREESRRFAVDARLQLWALAIQYLFYCVPLLVMAYFAWKKGGPWFGTVTFAGGSLLVVGWFVVREIRKAPDRHSFREKMRERRRARREAKRGSRT